MFDTNYNCKCGCGGDNCYLRHCSNDCWKYNSPQESPLHRQIIEKGIYDKGYCDGRLSAWNDYQNEIRQFRSYDDQKKFQELLREAMKPLEELRKGYYAPSSEKI